MSELTRSEERWRRREIARQALLVDGVPGIDDDPYWLCNLKGSVNTDDIRDMAKKLSQDATLLNEAARQIDEGELVPEEAALWLAERVNHGDYDTQAHLYDGLPITVEQ